MFVCTFDFYKDGSKSILLSSSVYYLFTNSRSIKAVNVSKSQEVNQQVIICSGVTSLLLALFTFL